MYTHIYIDICNKSELYFLKKHKKVYIKTMSIKFFYSCYSVYELYS